jgi:hypothetical protein
LVELALRFAVEPSGVGCGIFGAVTAEEVRSNLVAAGRPPLPPDFVRTIRSQFGDLTDRANFW